MATPIPANRVAFTLEEIVRATHGVMRAPITGDSVLLGVTSDSRRATGHEHADGHDVFVALLGDSFNGHDFVLSALQSGARCALISEWRAEYAAVETRCVVVEDTLTALGSLANRHRRRLRDLRVVGITGSVGKTTTKDLAVTALRAIGHSVVGTIGNLNNRIGVPMTLFTADESHQLAVIEMGMNSPGEIAELTRIAEPNVGMVTRVAAAHTEMLPSTELIAFEKAALLRGLEPTSTAIWNTDDVWIQNETHDLRAENTVTFGMQGAADVQIMAQNAVDGWPPKTQVSYRVRNREYTFTTALLGLGVLENLAAVVALMCALNEQAALENPGLHEAILARAPEPGRLYPIATQADVVLLDDTYNASPQAMINALQAASALARGRGGRCIAVLGDMLELGTLEEQLHRELSAPIHRSGCALFAACGPRMRWAVDECKKSGASRCVSFDDGISCVATVLEELRPRDVVLVKGSRGMRMERVVDALAQALHGQQESERTAS